MTETVCPVFGHQKVPDKFSMQAVDKEFQLVKQFVTLSSEITFFLISLGHSFFFLILVLNNALESSDLYTRRENYLNNSLVYYYHHHVIFVMLNLF